MKHLSMTGITNISRALLALGLVFSTVSASAQPPDAGPAQVSVSLAGSSTLSQGEPILLSYAVTNSGDLPLSVFTRDTQKKPFISEVFSTKAGETLVRAAPSPPPHKSPNEFQMWSGLSIVAHNTWHWTALANGYVRFPRPGDYLLRVHVQNPFVAGDIDRGTHAVLRGDFVFLMHVTPADPARLHAVAESLRRRIVRDHDVVERTTLIKALFSMPEASAEEVWRTLVEEPNLDGYALKDVTTALGRLGTEKAADILFGLIWSSIQPRSSLDEAAPEQPLIALYDAGNGDMKKHIEGLYKRHGTAMPTYRIQ